VLLKSPSSNKTLPLALLGSTLVMNIFHSILRKILDALRSFSKSYLF